MSLIVFEGLPTTAASSSCPAASLTSLGNTRGGRARRPSTEGTWISSPRWGRPVASTWRRIVLGFLPPRGCVLVTWAVLGGRHVVFRWKAWGRPCHRTVDDTGMVAGVTVSEVPLLIPTSPSLAGPEACSVPAVPCFAGVLALPSPALWQLCRNPQRVFIPFPETVTAPRGPSQSGCQLGFSTGFWP